jgi:large subunit ribosomal protein L9
MKVLLIKDVYKLGRAGDVKKVANGYGRNYLIPQGFAVLATPRALRQVEQIKSKADAERAILNKEMSGVAEKLADLKLTFAAKAGETGKLYGSITTQMIADAIQEQVGVELPRRQIDTQPLRSLGEHKVPVRLTIDLIPEISVIVYREGEALEMETGEEVLDEEATEVLDDGVEAIETVEDVVESIEEPVEVIDVSEEVVEIEQESSQEVVEENTEEEKPES